MIVNKQFSNIPEIGVNELEVIYQDIIPPQLRDTSPVLYDLFFLFLRYIEPTTRISFDFNLKNNEYFDTIDLQAFKRNIVNMFLNSFSVAFYKGLDDTEVINDLKKFFTAIGQDFVDIDRNYPFNDGFNFTEDLILFSQKSVTDKGKVNPFYYYAKLLSKTKLSFDDDTNFYINVEEGDKPFKYTVEGSLRRVLFNKIIKPLVHPVGFSYEYANKVYNFLEDYFDVEEIQSNFVVRISEGPSVRDFSSGVSFIYYTKDGFGKDNYLITYTDGSYIKKDGSGKIIFYSKDNTVLSVLERAKLTVSYDRKFVTRIKESLFESSNKIIKMNFWKYGCPRLGVDEKKLGEKGLKLCSFRIGGGYTKELFVYSEDYFITSDSSDSLITAETLQLEENQKISEKFETHDTITNFGNIFRLRDKMARGHYLGEDGLKLNDKKRPVIIHPYEEVMFPYASVDVKVLSVKSYGLFERMTTGYYLGEGIRLNDPKYPVKVLPYENVLFPNSTIDFEIRKK
jgi:hypothetical protein